MYKEFIYIKNKYGPNMYGIPDSLLALLFIGVLLLFAKLSEEAFEKFKLVPYVAAIFIGIIIGPGVLGLVTVLPNISLFISLGINFLLFTAGALEFRDVDMKEVLKGKALLIGILEFLIPFSLIALLVFLILHSFIIAIIAGIVMGMSSAGPLTRLLSDTGFNKTDEGNRIFQQVVMIEITAVIIFSFVTDFQGKAISLFLITSIALKLAIAIILVILFGKYVLTKFFARVDLSSRTHETLIASIVAFMLILGFVGQYYGFNSAIIALFLGIILRDFVKERPIVAEKISTLTYGFFEPLFFIGLGLYFVKITFNILILGVILFAIGLLMKPIAGAIFAGAAKVRRIKNALGTSVHGGVDAALLVVALSFTLVTPYDYSIIMFAITLLTLVVPMLFNIGSPVVPVSKTKYVWNILESQFNSIKVEDIVEKSQPMSVINDDMLSTAFQKCISNNVRGVIVLDKHNKVIGQLTLKDMLTLGRNTLRTLKVYEASMTTAIKTSTTSSGTDLLKLFREFDPPIIAVVDGNENFVGTILEGEIMKHISDILEKNE
jgi:Kef-type K+ transport system membrane component KefB/CBS domain-containing protein